MKSDVDLYKTEVTKPLDIVGREDFVYIPSRKEYFMNYNARWSAGPHYLLFSEDDFNLKDDDGKYAINDDVIRRIIQKHIDDSLAQLRGGTLNDSFSFKSFMDLRQLRESTIPKLLTRSEIGL